MRPFHFAALSSVAQTALAVTQLFQFSEPTQWIENIAVRPNGQLLLTTYDDARMYSFNPYGKNATPEVVAQLPNATALTGISEVAPDIFAFAGGVLNISSLSFEHDSGQIAIINFTTCRDTGVVPARTVAMVPGAQLLNGLVALPENPHIVLSSDSKTGTIYRANTVTGRVDIVFQDDMLTPGSDPTSVPLGVNGLKVRKNYLYLTNSGRQFFARIKINDLGAPSERLEILSQLPMSPPLVPDDFTFTKDGTAYIAAHPDAIVRFLDVNEWSVPSWRENMTLDTPTSVAVSKDEKTLFVVTGGSAEEGGKGGQLMALTL